MRSNSVLLLLIAGLIALAGAAFLLLREPGAASAPSGAATGLPDPPMEVRSVPVSAEPVSAPLPSAPVSVAPTEAATAARPSKAEGDRGKGISKPGRFSGRLVHPSPWPYLEAPAHAGCGPNCALALPAAADPRLQLDGTGGIANAIVELALPGGDWNGAGEEVALRLVDGAWSPSVAIVPLGASVVVQNNGTCELALRWQPQAASELLLPGAELRFRPTGIERLTLHDERHPWNDALLQVTANRYIAVTDASGAFDWPSVPQGEYSVQLWHVVLGKRLKLDVPIGGGRDTRLEISWEPAAPSVR
jgi:hypothetical protein